MAEELGCWTCNQQVEGSNSSLPTVECNPGQVVNTHVSVTKQYNLVPANWQWCLAAGSGITLAICHGHQWFSNYGLKALKREISIRLCSLSGVWWNLPGGSLQMAGNISVTVVGGGWEWISSAFGMHRMLVGIGWDISPPHSQCANQPTFSLQNRTRPVPHTSRSP